MLLKLFIFLYGYSIIEKGGKFYKIIFSPGSFFHGTKADLGIGDFLVTGMKKNYNDTRKSGYVYFAGTFEDDRNLTDKKFPGNPTKSYRTKQPLKIIAEVTKWERKGIKAMD